MKENTLSGRDRPTVGRLAVYIVLAAAFTGLIENPIGTPRFLRRMCLPSLVSVCVDVHATTRSRSPRLLPKLQTFVLLD